MTTNLISHPKENQIPERRLTDHLEAVALACQKRVLELRLNLSLISTAELARLSCILGLCHDLGKATTFFQHYIRAEQKIGNAHTHHSFLSAALAFYLVQEEFPDTLWPYVAFQVIRRHHGHLQRFDMVNKLPDIKRELKIAREQWQNIINNSLNTLLPLFQQYQLRLDGLRGIDFSALKDVVSVSENWLDELIGENKSPRLELFFIVNLLFSLLIDFDKKDAARLDHSYFAGNLVESGFDVFGYLADLRQKEPARFDPGLPMNALRHSFLQEIQNNPHISPERHFYTLGAPTGIGKTFGCMVFAQRLLAQLPGQQARIIYCLPYTSIIDQNFQHFQQLLEFQNGEKFRARPTRYLLQHHYLTPKTVAGRLDGNGESYSYKDYLDDVLWVESWESAKIVTTFVQFFHSVIGYQNRFLKKFHHIVNSIVILDEVQNIDPQYYGLLQEVFAVLGERFGIYFLLCTATQPRIFPAQTTPLHAPVALVDSQQYLELPLFNRVVLLVQTEPCGLLEFAQRFCQDFEAANVLLVMNTKKAAVLLYEYIRQHLRDYRVWCLTTWLTPQHRKHKIKAIRESLAAGERVIVVSTQLIEAGVDLSFKEVVRDYGPLDSIVQVAGRCNRHGEYGPLGGRMTLVKLLNEDHGQKPFFTYIYSPYIGQAVAQTLTETRYESRQFEVLAAEYFQKLDFAMKSQQLLAALRDLNYDEDITGQTPISDFQVIEELDTENLFLLTGLEAQQQMEEYLGLLQQLRQGEVAEEERDGVMLRIEQLKAELRQYCITVWEKDMAPFLHIIRESGFTRYISYRDCVAYAYDEEIGFLREPKELIKDEGRKIGS